jgi:arylsulfatase A-like enzyme
MIVRWPGVVAPGTHCDAAVANVDFYPTFVAAAGGAVPAGKLLDGESLLPLFKGQAAPKRTSLFWHFPGYLDEPVPRGRDPIFRTRPVSVIRKGDWKLHLYHEEWQLDGGREKIDSNRAVELYNIRTDIGERDDLALKNKSKRDELLDGLLAWMAEVKAPLPTRR